MTKGLLLLLPSLTASWVCETKLRLGAISLKMKSDSELDSHRRKLERVFVQNPMDFSIFRVDDEAPSWDLSTGETCGEDCDECEIPAELKLLPHSKQLDVMAFLGIQRAKPLHVVVREKDTGDLDWE